MRKEIEGEEEKKHVVELWCTHNDVTSWMYAGPLVDFGWSDPQSVCLSSWMEETFLVPIILCRHTEFQLSAGLHGRFPVKKPPFVLVEAHYFNYCCCQIKICFSRCLTLPRSLIWRRVALLKYGYTSCKYLLHLLFTSEAQHTNSPTGPLICDQLIDDREVTFNITWADVTSRPWSRGFW